MFPGRPARDLVDIVRVSIFLSTTIKMSCSFKMFFWFVQKNFVSLLVLMPSEETYRKLRVFVACPGDVEDEKERLGKIIDSFQFDAGVHRFFLQLVEWHQCVPDLGVPQEIIFDQLNPKAWDIFIGIFWTRFGSPSGIFDPDTHRELTGTEAEMLKAIDLYKVHGRPRVLIYRSMRVPKSLKDLRGTQLDAIERFFKDCEVGGKHPALVRLYEQPDDFERLVSEHLRKELAKVELSVELDEMKRTQEWQQDHLRVIQMVLPLLLPKKEQQHIMNLGLGRTSGYKGNHALRSELRRLRSMGLLENPHHSIGDIRDNLTVNLGEYVFLTRCGKEWATLIQQNEEMLAKDQPIAQTL